MSKKTLWLIVFILILLLGLVVAVYLVRQRTRIIGKAYGPTMGGEVEIANSYMFASPLKAKMGGERIRITVFILDGQGKGVMGKMVTLGHKEMINVDVIQATTDDLGKAIFDISSTKAGLYLIDASVEDKVLPQRVSITFE